MRTTTTAACSLAAALAACSTTIYDLNDSNSTEIAATVERPIEVAFRTTVQGLRSCARESTFRVQADYFPDNSTATITSVAQWLPGCC